VGEGVSTATVYKRLGEVVKSGSLFCYSISAHSKESSIYTYSN